MNRGTDLDLTGSLGGLRIANPDDISPSPSVSPDISKAAPAPDKSVSPITPSLMSILKNEAQPPPRQEGRSPVSPIESSPISLPPPQSSPSQSRDSYANRKSQRQSIPATYQEQQQAQFPQYPTMMPQNMHSPMSNSTRPVSSFYTQTPTTNPANGLVRDNSYRAGDEESGLGGVPLRSSSRGSSAALQAGVPSRDDSHSDRKYQSTNQYTSGNGPVPPRRASRGFPGAGRVGSSSGNMGPLSASPYGMEGGPLQGSDDWKEKGAAVGIQQDYDSNGVRVSRYVKKGVLDFTFGQTLGQGSYSTVMAATDRQTLKEYAIKILDKKHIIKEKKIKYVNIEKDTLNKLTDVPGVVRLYYTFQDETSLYYVLDLCSGGELLGFLKKMTTFDEECTRFYGAQILETVEQMHRRGVIHRDLKPENVLLDDKMHVKITDFGTAKILDPPDKTGEESGFQPDQPSRRPRASSFVGTAEYVSPELLTDKNACKASDLWAFGCIIYQLLAGRPPFKAANEYLTFRKIVELDYEYPRGFPEVARDLVERLLTLDPQRRLSIEHVKNHQFFDGITWGRGLWKQKAPRLKAYVPAPQPIIKLNGTTSNESYLSDLTPGHSTNPTRLPPAATSPVSRPPPRIITELPPPSQLDIEWSPVLTRNNERILKLGNLSVESKPKPDSPAESGGGNRFSRFFSGGNIKKRQRLVMVTSSGRIIMAAAGGDEKRSKSEISLLEPGTQFTSHTDAKGIVSWSVDSLDKRHTFEDVKSSSSPFSSNPSTIPSGAKGTSSTSLVKSPPLSRTNTSAVSAQDWLETLSRAKELALSQATNAAAPYSYADSLQNLSGSALSSAANTLDTGSMLRHDDSQTYGGTDGTRMLTNESGGAHVGTGTGRAILQKHPHGGQNPPLQSDRGLGLESDTLGPSPGSGPGGNGPPPSSGKSKRFSKRQSKGILAAVF